LSTSRTDSGRELDGTDVFADGEVGEVEFTTSTSAGALNAE
jgi:hypothetical protein